MKSTKLLALSLILLPAVVSAEVSLIGSAVSVAVEENNSDIQGQDASAATVEADPEASATFLANYGQSAQSASFINSMKKLSDYIKEDNAKELKWHWSNSDNKTNFEAQKKSGHYVCNGPLFIVWALADMGVFKNGEKFHTNDGGVLKFREGTDTEKVIKENFNIIEVNKTAVELINEGKLLPGDICCYDYQHTNAYAGNGMWFDAFKEGCEVTQKDGESYYKEILSNIGSPNGNVAKILRFKDVITKSEEPAIVKSINKEPENNESNSSDVVETFDRLKFYDKVNLTNFKKALNNIHDILKEDYKAGKGWHWENSEPQVQRTYPKQVKSGMRASNCNIMICWALNAIGAFQNNERFWGNPKGVHYCKNNKKESSKKTIAKYCEIIECHNKTAKQLIKEGKLKVGDICCYHHHNNVYAGNGKWWDTGRGTGNTKYKNGKYYFNGTKTSNGCPSSPITHIFRLKDQN